jgi:hypothetical protein
VSQPVKLSDSLVLDARQAGEVFQRSIAGQVEFWARLGRSVEELLDGRQIVALAREKSTVPLSELVANLGAPQSTKRLNSYLETLPFPHYAAHPKKAGLLIRTQEDGQRSVGRFANRQFVVDETIELAEGDADEIRPTAAKR